MQWPDGGRSYGRASPGAMKLRVRGERPRARGEKWEAILSTGVNFIGSAWWAIRGLVE